MHRVKNCEEYFVFAGGGVEEGETPEEAVIREIKEELCLDAKISRFLFKINNIGREEFYYLITKFNGKPRLGGEEKERNCSDNQFEPVWVELDNIKQLDSLYPQEAKEKLLSIFI